MRAERVAIERLAQELLDGVGQVGVLKALANALDLDQVRRELDALVADRSHGGAQEARLVARGAAKQQAGVLGPRLREHLERRVRDGQQLGVSAAVRAHARDRLRLLEAVVLVYINRHGRAFLFSVAGLCARWR